MNTSATWGYGRPAMIIGAAAAGIGLVGFLIGIGESVTSTRAALPDETPVVATAPIAPSYRAIDASAVGPNQGWSSAWSALKQNRPGPFDPVIRTPAMKNAALADRLRTRAFDGAPPVIPHLVERASADHCLACHADGLRLGEKIATKVCHPLYSNCLQCHVEQAGGPRVATRDANVVGVSNDFAGALRSGPGSRAAPGAPPTIPHTLQLRGNCLSCHGLVARPGLRTTHPWLQNCLQCHAVDAATERPRIAAIASPEAGKP